MFKIFNKVKRVDHTSVLRPKRLLLGEHTGMCIDTFILYQLRPFKINEVQFKEPVISLFEVIQKEINAGMCLRSSPVKVDLPRPNIEIFVHERCDGGIYSIDKIFGMTFLSSFEILWIEKYLIDHFDKELKEKELSARRKCAKYLHEYLEDKQCQHIYY